ncbi:MAG TPA: hypothetical protein VFX35_12495 [Solirubrobacterales bacterium]|nr:hypothetical protein [Solirubrobacterales bacterium]
MSEIHLEAVTIGDPLEDTPDGLALMDRLRDAEGERRANIEHRFGPAALALLDEAEKEAERAILFGDGLRP